MDVFHHDLEAIEASCFGDLDLIGKPFNEVFVDNAVGRGEEGEDVRDKVTLAWV